MRRVFFTLPIVAAGVDLHLVMIASDTLCLLPPTGSGACPGDENLPLYRHVETTVGSNNSLSKVLTTYDQWTGQLRTGATKTIIVVTDGDSGLPANDFDTSLLALDPAFENYKFHGLINANVENCADVGLEYISLAELTGGTIYDICLDPFVVRPGLQGIAQLIVDDLGGPTPPPSGDCDILAGSAVDAGQDYVHAARVVKRICRKSSGPDCVDTLLQAAAAFAAMGIANTAMENGCP